MKLIEKIRRYEEAGNQYFSFEFFPPRTATGVDNL